MKEADRSKIQALVQILDTGTFPLKAKEVPAFFAVYKWVKGLEDRIELPQSVKVEPLDAQPPKRKRTKKA